jgi:cell division protein FtsN
MRRVNRRLKNRPASRGRLVLFLAGGIATAVLLVVVLISLEQRSPVQSALPGPPVGAAPKNPNARPTPQVPSPDKSPPTSAPEAFTFYDTLEQRGTPHPGFPAKVTKPSAGGPSTGTAAPEPGIVSPKNPSPGYTVQIASIRDRATAEALANRLRRKGYPAFILPHVVPKRGTWYRVRVGHFKQREAALEMTQRLSGQERLMAYVARE